MSVLTVTECVSVIAAEATMQSALVDALAVGYGISSTAIGIGLILMGVAVLRTRTWRGLDPLHPIDHRHRRFRTGGPSRSPD